MRLIAENNNPQPLCFVIQYDKRVGYYLYLYTNNFCVYDDLQDTFERVVSIAHEKFGISPRSWQQETAGSAQWISAPARQKPLIILIEEKTHGRFAFSIFMNDQTLYCREFKKLNTAKEFAHEKLGVSLAAWGE
jgi:hypothetical protein